MRIDDPFAEGGRHPADEIIAQETHMAHGILDIVPEDPEVKHVAAEVQKASMQEHRGDQGQPRPRNAVDARGYGVIEEVAGDKTERKKERLAIPFAER